MGELSQRIIANVAIAHMPTLPFLVVHAKANTTRHIGL
jgi:hypothetical protein